MTHTSQPVALCSYSDVRARLLGKLEIALLDVREEDPHAQSHPLFAANFPLSRLEQDAFSKLPRRDAPIVTIDGGECADITVSEAYLAAQRLLALGYSDVALLNGGIKAWAQAGGELFIDVNVPSKSFGEMVESKVHTPSLSAEEVQALIDHQADVVIVDARRYDEYNTMSIPTAISCPGAELVLRIAQLAPDPATKVIVNCAGRTRSIIGTQSLINAGIPNSVSALRNGTIGWLLAGQELDRGQQRKFSPVGEATQSSAAARARSVADRAGVKRASLDEVQIWKLQQSRTTYFFDTRTPEEFAAGHLPGFRSTPGGQLVQETEMVAPVRGARLVLVDTDGVRANMTASWLAQMAWDVCVLDHVAPQAFNTPGSWIGEWPALPLTQQIQAHDLLAWLGAGLVQHTSQAQQSSHPKQSSQLQQVVVIDLSKHAQYVQGHIPGAYYVLRSKFSDALNNLPAAERYVLTCPDGIQSSFSCEEITRMIRSQPEHSHAEVYVLQGGTQAWKQAGQPLEAGPTHLASPPLDRYKRPYEGTDNGPAAMQAYLDWEYGLVEQLGRDGTHHFWVLT
jgi:rhodanese-related sulfurtransferase